MQGLQGGKLLRSDGIYQIRSSRQADEVSHRKSSSRSQYTNKQRNVIALQAEQDQILGTLEISEDYIATVVRYAKGGVIVNLPFISKTAYCPYRELSDYDGFISEEYVKEVVMIGDNVAVQITNIDEKRNSISCSIKAADQVKAKEYGDLFKTMQQEWKAQKQAERDAVEASKTKIADLEVGQEMSGTVSSLAAFGVFVDAKCDRDILLPLRNLDLERDQDPATKYKQGDELKFFIHQVENRNGKMQASGGLNPPEEKAPAAATTAQELPFEVGDEVSAVVQDAKRTRGTIIFANVEKDDVQYPARMEVDEAEYDGSKFAYKPDAKDLISLMPDIMDNKPIPKAFTAKVLRIVKLAGKKGSRMALELSQISDEERERRQQDVSNLQTGDDDEKMPGFGALLQRAGLSASSEVRPETDQEFQPAT